MISWWLSYLAKGHTPDFNDGLGNDSNSGCMLALQRLLESDLNNGPPQAIPILCQMEKICSGILLMVSWWVLYLPKSCRSDLNNGLGGDSNSGPVLVSAFISV